MDLHYLHRDAFFCLVEEGAIFLNARLGEYLALENARLATISCFIAGWPPACMQDERSASADAPSERLLAELVRRGILTTSAAAGKAAEPVTLANRSARPSLSYRDSLPRLRLSLLLRFILALSRTTQALRRRHLLSLLRRIEAAKAGPRHRSAAEVKEGTWTLVRNFDRLRVWCYSAEGACLRDSLVLAEFLLRCGAVPTLVIGVRSRPFAAHAWVQDGDVVLNDTLENVQRYTPILAV